VCAWPAAIVSNLPDAGRRPSRKCKPPLDLAGETAAPANSSSTLRSHFEALGSGENDGGDIASELRSEAAFLRTFARIDRLPCAWKIRVRGDCAVSCAVIARDGPGGVEERAVVRLDRRQLDKVEYRAVVAVLKRDVILRFAVGQYRRHREGRAGEWRPHSVRPNGCRWSASARDRRGLCHPRMGRCKSHRRTNVPRRAVAFLSVTGILRPWRYRGFRRRFRCGALRRRA
jgi:hypothetical protein